MSESTAGLRRKLASAADLHAVVRTMKALAASSIGQYQHAVQALAGYDRSVSQGLGECFRQARVSGGPNAPEASPRGDADKLGAIVFGSDQGLVGQFNDVIAEHAIRTLAAIPGTPQVWAIGERVQALMVDAGLHMAAAYALPRSVDAITALVERIQIDIEAHRIRHDYSRVYVFHNRPKPDSVYEPGSQRLLPLDASWQEGLAAVPWPGRVVPEVLGSGASTLRALVGEYLFISLFRACAESLASENASRLAAMERADRNIKELVEELQGTFHRLRQSTIDDELFDVTSGYEALAARSSA